MVAALLVLVAFRLVVLLVLGIMLLVLLKLLVLLEVVGIRADKSADRFEKKIRQIALVVFWKACQRNFFSELI